MLARIAAMHGRARRAFKAGALMLKLAGAENPARRAGRALGHALPLLAFGRRRAALRRGVAFGHARRQPPGLLRRRPSLPLHAGAPGLLRDGARRRLRRAARRLHDLLRLRLADLHAAARGAGRDGRAQRRRLEPARAVAGLGRLRGGENPGGRVRGRPGRDATAGAAGAIPPILYVLAAALLWSTGGLFIKATPLDAFQLSFGRSLFAAVTVAVLTRREGFRANGLTLVSSVLYAALLLLFVMANKLTTAANAIFLQYTAPVYVMVLEPLLFKERFRRSDVFVVAACVVGMSLFFVGQLRPQDVEGNLTALASGACFALFLLSLR